MEFKSRLKAFFLLLVVCMAVPYSIQAMEDEKEEKLSWKQEAIIYGTIATVMSVGIYGLSKLFNYFSRPKEETRLQIEKEERKNRYGDILDKQKALRNAVYSMHNEKVLGLLEAGGESSCKRHDIWIWVGT